MTAAAHSRGAAPDAAGASLGRNTPPPTVRRLLDTCLDTLTAQRQGHTPPPLTRVPAVFEHELPAGS